MSQEKIVNTLLDLGLTRIEAKIYVLLTKKGAVKARDLGSTLKISKQRLYPSLKNLQRKGLVNATLKYPSRFSAVPFDQALDLFAKIKMEEAKNIQQNRKNLLEDWKSIIINNVADTSEKFTIIEGRKHVYSKIQQMIQETKRQLSTITTVEGLIRAYQHGLLDYAFNHPLKSELKFRFLTELSDHNINSLKSLFEKAPTDGFDVKGRNPELGLKLSPRMVIRDNEELLFFTTSPTEDDACLWTTCKELVSSFSAVFNQLWCNSTDVKETIDNTNKVDLRKTTIFENSDKANKKYEEILNLAEKEIIHLISAKGIIALADKLSLLKKCSEKNVSIKIMAPITSENIEIANQFSKYFEVKHVHISYLETTIVDGKHLFQSRTTLADKKIISAHFQNLHYITDLKYIEKMEKILRNLWRTSSSPSNVTIESVTKPPKSTSDTGSSQIFQETVRRIHAPVLIKDEEQLEELTEKKVIDILVNAQRYPNTNFSDGIARTYGSVGQAIVRPPSKLNLPEMLFLFLHFEKYSTFGAEDVIQVFVKQKTPTGYGFLPVIFMGDNQKSLDFQSKALTGLFYKDNFQLCKKDEIQVQVHGNTFFCCWTMEIPLIEKYVLPPGSILLEGYNDVKANELEMQYPSGYKLWNVYNGIEAFVTFFHPSSKYSGPGTDGFIMRDAILEMYPPKS